MIQSWYEDGYDSKEYKENLTEVEAMLINVSDRSGDADV